jgi:tRNA(Ile)-lysidine synthase
LNEARPLPPCEPPADRLWVGFSGGLDSTVLLHWLNRNRPVGQSLQAIHINHGLHPDADAWAAHCQAVCDDAGIELHCRQVVIADRQRNIEAQARAARYAAFAQYVQSATLALAHHSDDLAETLLLRLLRGAGTEALANMQEHGRMAGVALWRPLLANTRADLEAYAKHHGLHWIDDTSNTDTGFDRNFLRHTILPLLESRFANVPGRLAHSAALLLADAGLLQPQIDTALSQCRTQHGLRVAALKTLPEALQAHVLRAWLAELDMNPPGSYALKELIRQLADHRPEQQTQYLGDDYGLQAWNGILHHFSRLGMVDTHAEFSMVWDGHSPLPLPRGGVLSWQGSAPFPLRVSYRIGGERIRLPGRGMRHSVKKLLSTQVPPWQRDALPFVYNEHNELLAVGTVLISQTLADCTELTGSRLHWQH